MIAVDTVRGRGYRGRRARRGRDWYCGRNCASPGGEHRVVKKRFFQSSQPSFFFPGWRFSLDGEEPLYGGLKDLNRASTNIYATLCARVSLAPPPSRHSSLITHPSSHPTPSQYQGARQGHLTIHVIKHWLTLRYPRRRVE